MTALYLNICFVHMCVCVIGISIAWTWNEQCKRALFSHYVSAIRIGFLCTFQYRILWQRLGVTVFMPRNMAEGQTKIETTFCAALYHSIRNILQSHGVRYFYANVHIWVIPCQILSIIKQSSDKGNSNFPKSYAKLKILLFFRFYGFMYLII